MLKITTIRFVERGRGGPAVDTIHLAMNKFFKSKNQFPTHISMSRSRYNELVQILSHDFVVEVTDSSKVMGMELVIDEQQPTTTLDGTHFINDDWFVYRETSVAEGVA